MHVYVDRAADLAKARAVILNAKTRRTGICGAAECLLIDRAFFEAEGAPFLTDLVEAGVEVRGDDDLLALPGVVPAGEDDWGREFLDMIIAARLVDGVDGAIAHIRRYGSQHTDCILTEDDAAAARFFERLDSAILMRNASTQFADGGEFGMGAEIGIATGKLHARGPVGAEQLTSFKYLVEGDGTIRVPEGGQVACTGLQVARSNALKVAARSKPPASQQVIQPDARRRQPCQERTGPQSMCTKLERL